MLASALNMVRSKAGFVQQFIRNPRAIGSITPSSVMLCETMAKSADWQTISRVAELGAGDGVLTRLLLQYLDPHASLDIFEINPRLVQQLHEIHDHRLAIHAHSAEHLNGRYDAIFSGLPLLSLPAKTRHAILEKVHHTLTPGGIFIQFQYTSLTQPELSRYFIWERQRVIKNVPPAWVYRCRHHWSDQPTP
ncbi:class I SAM-dependent methyltransferase [Rosenbergiella australiborealis]|uniref:class I SAM-dependent methyltransferase n=1 Tax=Rosenbergiella australiborealis TaxID=1544696 RepID=UPI001F4D90D2|nr:methyltransferase [Rosenbergiella australiborealis]